MKVYAISDLHLSINSNKPMDIFGPAWENYLNEIEDSWKSLVKDEDIVLISGDISWAMKLTDALPDLEYIAKLPGKKIILKGNHDYWWSAISSVRNILPFNMYALQNDCIKINNVLFCGSRGWAVPDNDIHKTEEDEKIYKRELIRLELSLTAMQKQRKENDVVIAMLHFPPFNYKTENSEVTNLLEKFKVDKVVYGHLHNYDVKQNVSLEKNNITYYLTSCDIVQNKLIEIL